MADVLIDTDVFIDHLRGARRLSLDTDAGWYSVVTRCELFAGTSPDEDTLRVLLAPFHELAVDRVVAERAGRIRRQFGGRIADALIAATALEYALQLLTRNVKHFAGIPGLQVRSP